MDKQTYAEKVEKFKFTEKTITNRYLKLFRFCDLKNLLYLCRSKKYFFA